MAEARDLFRQAMMATIGRAPAVIEPGRLHRFATSARSGDSAGWCKLFEDQRGGVFGCFRSGVTHTWTAGDRALMSREQLASSARHAARAAAERMEQQRQQWRRNALRIARIWSECVPLRLGDPVAQYLKARGLGDVRPSPSALRLHRALPYWHGEERLGSYPAMVVPLVSPDGRTVALHRTYLTVDGQKAPVPTVKKLTGAAGPLTGACLPLYFPARGRLGIAEGVETALAARCASGVATVAAYCASSLASWQWPQGIHRLIVFADGDKVGRAAADKLQARARRVGLRCDVLAPTGDTYDWCDVWATRSYVEAA